MRILRQLLVALLVALAPQAWAQFNTFGGGVTTPGQVSYAAIALTGNITLSWPNFAGTPNVVASIMDVTPSAGGFAINMPDARQAGTGTVTVFRNLGSFNFTVQDNTGATVISIPAGIAYLVYLTNNTTQAGSWGLLQYGAGTSSANSATLAGSGLQAIGLTLAQSHPATTTGSPVTISSASLAQNIVMTGGSQPINLPTSASVGPNFFFLLKNAGSGTGTLTPSGADTVDGVASVGLSPNDACVVLSLGSGNGWVTVGLGRSTNFSFTQLVLNVAGNADITETNAQAANKIQTFTGVLTGNINVIMPAAASTYYVFNNTSGAFSLTVKIAGGTGVAITQGSHDIVVSDSTNVYKGITNVVGTTLFAAGSAGAPSITFTGNQSTGLYLPSANVMGATANGFEVQSWNGPAASVNWIDTFSSATGAPPRLAANGTDANIGFQLRPKGTGLVQFTDGTDTTKIVAIDVSGVSTGTTVTLKAPNASGTLSFAPGTQTLTDGATINWNTASGSIASVTTAGNRTFAAPTNLSPGRYVLTITQDATGGRTHTFNAVFKTSNGMPFPQPQSAANSSTIYDMHSDGTNLYLVGSTRMAGELVDYAGTAVPAGWLQCDGSAVSRTTYAALFAAIGTTWGVGDGATTFNVPDFRRRVAVGSGGSGTGTLGNSVGNTGGEETHTQTVNEMPSHTHVQNAHTHTVPGDSTGVGASANARNGSVGGGADITTSSVTAVNQNTGGGAAFNVIQPSAVVLKIIKFNHAENDDEWLELIGAQR